ncbi:MAG: hypothetical protein J6U10_02600 [Lachnospiraceae bacterium]|nr:hypothetical protein [Lachnospiraceae bacterium]
MKQNNDYHMNVGGASMILLLVVFALTIFAALSVRASYHEMKLSEKTRNAVQEYYLMDKKATEKMVAIEEALFKHELRDFTPDEFEFEGVEVLPGGSGLPYKTLNYSIKSETSEKTLNVSLVALRGSIIRIASWALSEDEHGNYDSGNGGEIWNGEIVIVD